jgi:hypothetical protein
MSILRSYAATMVLVTVCLLCSACQLGGSGETAANPTAPAASAISANEGTAATPVLVPTSAPGKGVVRGIVVHIDTKKPLTDHDGATLFLAGIIDGEVRTAALDKLNAPRAIIDTEGNFVFSNVDPGEYVVVMVTPISEFLLRDSTNQTADLIVKVEADKTFEVGTVVSKFP